LYILAAFRLFSLWEHPLGRVDSYLIQSTAAAMVTTAR
jgi:hypothetical protein